MSVSIATSNSSALFTGDFVSLWRSAGLWPQSSELDVAILKLPDIRSAKQSRDKTFVAFNSTDCGGSQPNATCCDKVTHVECAVEMNAISVLSTKIRSII